MYIEIFDMHLCINACMCIYIYINTYVYIPVNPLPGVETNGLINSILPGLLL